MRRAVVVIVLAAALPSGTRARTLDLPTTLPPGVLDMAPAEQGLIAGLTLRAITAVPAEERPGTVLDWYPAPGGFRVTGGLREPADPRRRSLDPYLGFGWQGAIVDDSVLVGLDFGAFYRGRPDVRVVENDAAQDAGTEDPQRRGAAIALPFEPVFSITFTYRF